MEAESKPFGHLPECWATGSQNKTGACKHQQDLNFILRANNSHQRTGKTPNDQMLIVTMIASVPGFRFLSFLQFGMTFSEGDRCDDRTGSASMRFLMSTVEKGGIHSFLWDFWVVATISWSASLHFQTSNLQLRIAIAGQKHRQDTTKHCHDVWNSEARTFSWTLCAISDLQNSVSNLDQKHLQDTTKRCNDVWSSEARTLSWVLCAISDVQNSVANLYQRRLPGIAGRCRHVWGFEAGPFFTVIIRVLVARNLCWDS
jgi:hypothetical protein